MLKHIRIFAVILAIAVLIQPLSVFATDDNVSLNDYMTNEREKTKGDEVAYVADLLCEEGHYDMETGTVDVKNLVTAYKLDIEKMVNSKEPFDSFEELMTEDYFYRYFNTADETVIELVRSKEDGQWIVLCFSLEIKGYLEKFPNLSYIPGDVTARITEAYPDLDYDSVKFIYLDEVSQTLVYFTCNGESYIAYYPLVEIDNGLRAGEIYTADHVLEVIDNYPIYNPNWSDGTIGGIAFTPDGDYFADTFIENMVTENQAELSPIIEMLQKNELGCGVIPDDPEDILPEDLVKLYRFEDMHLVNVYNESGSLSDNFNSEYYYKYFCEEKGGSIEIRKITNDEWDIATYDLEVKVRKERFPNQPSTFKEMIADVFDKYPNLDQQTVKYIEYSILGTFIVYFSANGTEYLATYPLSESDEEFGYGTIYSLAEFIDKIDEYPAFNRTEPLEGYGGADIGVLKTNKTTPWYLYAAIGVAVVAVAGGITLLIIKKKKNLE